MSTDAHQITLAQLGEFVSHLGIDWNVEDLSSIDIVPGKVTVTRSRRNESGRHYVLPGTGEFATEVVTIAVTR